MKYALIGCGRIARNHIKAALSNRLDIVAVCDLRPEKMKTLLSECDVLNAENIDCCTDYRQMLDLHPDIELVSIATESGSHAKIALECIAHGIHAIIEKPMAMSIADADAIIAAARRYDVKVSACHQNRFNLAVQEMRKALDAGRFGRISHGSVHVRWNRDRAYYEQAPWRGTWKDDGGALMNQCIHGIDLLRWMMGGEIDSVYGKTCQRFHEYLEAEDVGMAVVTFKNGTIATVEGTTNVYPQNLEETLYLFGERGTIKLGGKSVNHIDVWEFENESDADKKNRSLQELTADVYGNGHTRLFADMIRAIHEKRQPYVDAQAGKDALELVLAIYKSSAEGTPVKLPLLACSSIDFFDLFAKRECKKPEKERDFDAY